MFNIRIVKIGFFWGFHYNPLIIDLYPLFWTHTPPPCLEISKSSWLCHTPPDPSITVFYPETRKTRTKISQDWVIRFAKKKLGIIDVLTRVSTDVNLEPDGQAHREERVL
jgi:hypothetical protein